MKVSRDHIMETLPIGATEEERAQLEEKLDRADFTLSRIRENHFRDALVSCVLAASPEAFESCDAFYQYKFNKTASNWPFYGSDHIDVYMTVMPTDRRRSMKLGVWLSDMERVEDFYGNFSDQRAQLRVLRFTDILYMGGVINIDRFREER